MLAAGDPYRPAAAEQLRTLGQQIDVPVFFEENVKPPELAKHAFEKARNGGFTVVIMDTAGRSQLDSALMSELQAIARITPPTETLSSAVLVAKPLPVPMVPVTMSLRAMVPPHTLALQEPPPFIVKVVMPVTSPILLP